jgi:topoisomerase-4 subunit A
MDIEEHEDLFSLQEEPQDTSENTDITPVVEDTFWQLEPAGQISSVKGLFQNWFLDYASYVILERAVPALEDGLKPVQRRILHAMYDLEDGRYNKVANIIGHAMKYHPHGDASIGEALVQLGQKDLLIDMQGNWGNVPTGDGAAAPRYIEARLSKFAKEVVYNPKTTQWIKSYDGRNDEPLHLPIKFPLLLAQGAEGIAVGMACKILPHNFNELIECSIDLLKGKDITLLPDFMTGGMADFSDYKKGLRGGRVRIRAKIHKLDANTLVVQELPFGTTTGSLIESILKANEKGKIKIKKIEDNTSEKVEILVHLASGVSPDKTIDALYAFTDCEISIAPNASIIQENNQPLFLDVHEILRHSTQNTVRLLEEELKIKEHELKESWHAVSLEKIFIEQKIYRHFEGETYERALEITLEKLQPHIAHLHRAIEQKDLEKLLEIRMRRITKHDAEKADELLKTLSTDLAQTQEYLANLVEYAIDYFKQLKKSYGKGRERKTEIKSFDTIQAKDVVLSNRKLYANLQDGFLGYGLKKDTFLFDCSDLDDVIIFFQDGKVMVSQVAEKKFVGKNIIHVFLWKKADTRTVYHAIYQDSAKGYPMGKRFFAKSMMREKLYDMTKGLEGAKLIYLSQQANGEQEIVKIHLKPVANIKMVSMDYDFSTLPIKPMTAVGLKITHRVIDKIEQSTVGASTLAATEYFYDADLKRLNTEARGQSLGFFQAEDKLLLAYASGTYQVIQPDTSLYLENDVILVQKFMPNMVLSVIYHDGERDSTYSKRFILEALERKVRFVQEHKNTKIYVLSTQAKPQVLMQYQNAVKGREKEELDLSLFVEVKGLQAIGKEVSKYKVKKVSLLQADVLNFIN